MLNLLHFAKSYEFDLLKAVVLIELPPLLGVGLVSARGRYFPRMSHGIIAESLSQ